MMLYVLMFSKANLRGERPVWDCQGELKKVCRRHGYARSAVKSDTEPPELGKQGFERIHGSEAEKHSA